jgi:hypothetical protein
MALHDMSAKALAVTAAINFIVDFSVLKCWERYSSPRGAGTGDQYAQPLCQRDRLQDQ